MPLVKEKEVLSKYYRKWIKQMDANDKFKWGQIFFHVTVQKMKFSIKDFSSKCGGAAGKCLSLIITA